MTISLYQRIKLLFLRSIIWVIWSFDVIANVQKRVVFIPVSAVATAFIIFFFVVTSPFTNGKYISYGIVYSLYGGNKTSNFGSTVLGAKDIRVEYPIQTNNSLPPKLTAKSALVMDRNNNKTLFELNKLTRLAPASTSKLMTALVALDLYSLDETIKVPFLCTKTESQKLGLKTDEEVSVRDLIYGMLVGSGGDAACTLSVDKVTWSEFVNLMNAKAKDIGMYNTQFTNPVGLDGAHFSTADDLYALAKHTMDTSFISKIVATKEYKFNSVSKNNPLTVYNTNKLLWEIPQSVGIKTGTTQEAGEVLIYEYRKQPVDLIIIVMGSQDRFSDTKNLLYWTLNNYSWEN